MWPELDVICTSLPLPLGDYLETIGDAKLAIDTMVGDTQRHELFGRKGYAIPQELPEPVRAASRLLPES